MNNICLICEERPRVKGFRCNRCYVYKQKFNKERPKGLVPASALSVLDRFMAKVQKTESCWLWTAGTFSAMEGTTNLEYGCFWDGTGMVPAHKMSWELHNGPVPEGMKVLHNCPEGDNSLCVNPDHLWLGTQKENVHDAIAKGRARHLRGSSHPCAKLTNEQAIKVREAEQVNPQLVVARIFRISVRTVQQIAAGKHHAVRGLPRLKKRRKQ